MTDPCRGEIWQADLGTTRGHEQAGARPVLVLSVNQFNQGPADLVVVLPITSRLRGIPMHVPIKPPEGGTKTPSVILCDAIRSISKDRFGKRWGTVSGQTMATVEDRVRILLGV